MTPPAAGAVAGLLLNAFVWGVSWYPFRILDTAGLHPLWSTVCIYALALAALLLWRPQAWRALRHAPLLWLLMLASGLTNVGFNWAVTSGDVVRVVLLFYLMPAWTVLLAWLWLGQRPDGGALARLALALGGVYIVLHSPQAPWPLPRSLPDALALLGGFSFALTNLLLLRLKDTPDEARAFGMFGGGLLLALLVAVLGAPSGAVPAPPALASDWVPLALTLGLVFLAANLGLQYGAARLSAHTTALILLTEVVFASVSSLLLGAAEPQARTLAGGALILLAAVWSAARGR
jgi:drug/metabolite transporter (DMT)-like permease